MPQVGDPVVVLDPQLARWLVEPTGTILEVRCDGGHVKVEHDGTAREERYYNTGKDGVYQPLVRSRVCSFFFWVGGGAGTKGSMELELLYLWV